MIHFELPPLRDRRDDIELLARHFLAQYAALNGKTVTEISPEAMQALISYDFPGNVREIENIIERGVIFSRTHALSIADLQLEGSASDGLPPLETISAELPFREAKERAIQHFHSGYIRRLLEQHGGNISRAAESAGIQRQYLHRLMKEAGIEAVEYKQKDG